MFISLLFFLVFTLPKTSCMPSKTPEDMLCREIYFTGSGEDAAKCYGTYKLTEIILGGAPVYKKANEDRYMFKAGVGDWRIGSHEGLQSGGFWYSQPHPSDEPWEKSFGQDIAICIKWRCCDPGWVPWRGSCYHFETDVLNFVESISMCAVHGGSLVEIDNAEEEAFLEGQIGIGSGAQWWIGVAQTPLSTPQWLSGKVGTFKKFCEDEPKEFGRTIRVTLDDRNLPSGIGREFCWRTEGIRNEYKAFGYICEKDSRVPC